MRVSKGINIVIPEMDMTPMIDVTFQLIIFFMLVINFAEGETLQVIQLPISELAQPAEKPPTDPLTLHVARPDEKTGVVYVYFGGETVPVDALDTKLEALLQREKQFLELHQKTPADATIIIRGDGRAQTVHVQKVIEICQKVGYENFMLRAKADSSY